MNEFRFLVGAIVILELVLFACGLKVVENRHNARKLFIELEHEQQVHHSLMDEKARLKLEISNLEQIRQVEVRAKEGGLAPAENDRVIVLDKNVAPSGAQNENQAVAQGCMGQRFHADGRKTRGR